MRKALAHIQLCRCTGAAARQRNTHQQPQLAHGRRARCVDDGVAALQDARQHELVPGRAGCGGNALCPVIVQVLRKVQAR